MADIVAVPGTMELYYSVHTNLISKATIQEQEMDNGLTIHNQHTQGRTRTSNHGNIQRLGNIRHENTEHVNF